MDNSPEYWTRVIIPEMFQLVGRRYPAVENMLPAMSVEALREFHRFLQDAQQEVMAAKKSVQMWPGGPRVRM